MGTAKINWQTNEGGVEKAAVGQIADAAAGLTGGLANAAAGLVKGLATDEGAWEGAVAMAGSTLTSGVMSADQTFTHASSVCDQGDEMASVHAEVNYDETVVGNWAQTVEGAAQANDPISEYDAQVAAADEQQVQSDDGALITEAQGVTDADVGQSDNQESAIVNLADEVDLAAAGETGTTSAEVANAIGTAATDVAGAVGGYAQAQNAFIKSAAGAIVDDDTATVKADVGYDNAVAADGEGYVDKVAPAAAALYVAGYTPDAWVAYNQIVQNAASDEQTKDQQANVTRVQQIGTAEVGEAAGLGAAQTSLATAAGQSETGLVGQLVDKDNQLAGEEATADEGFATTLGGDLADFMTGMAESDQNWVTAAGGALEQFQQSLGDDEVTAADGISQAEAGYAEEEAQNEESDAQNVAGPSPSGQAAFNEAYAQAYEKWLQDVAPTFENDSKQVAQDDATLQKTLLDDAVNEAEGETTAELAYAQAEGPAVKDLVSTMAGVDDD